jgi:hypothetical protein
MSQVNSTGNAVVDMFAQQFQAMNNPVLNVNDLNRINNILLTSFLQAGVKIFQGCVDALNAAAETAQQKAPASTSAQKVTIE